jgi:hypothetical protein
MNTVLLTTERYARLNQFLGYGRINAPLWFVGLEERTREDDIAIIENDLNVRRQFNSVMDLLDAHRLFDATIQLSRTRTPTWLWAAKFARALLENANDWQINKLAREYIDNRLGRKQGKTFLTELLCVPTPRIGKWLYDGLWPKRGEYERSVLADRSLRLIKLIQENQPKFVLAYGVSNYNALVSALEKPKEIICERNIKWGCIGQSIVVLTPFFGGRFKKGLRPNEATEIVNVLKSLR